MEAAGSYEAFCASRLTVNRDVFIWLVRHQIDIFPLSVGKFPFISHSNISDQTSIARLNVRFSDSQIINSSMLRSSFDAVL